MDNKRNKKEGEKRVNMRDEIIDITREMSNEEIGNLLIKMLVEKGLSHKLMEEFHINVMHEVSLGNRDNLINALIIQNICNIITTGFQPGQIEEFYRGGHFVLRDEGRLHDELIKSGLYKERISSHHNSKVDKKESPDGSMQAGVIFKEFLLGLTIDNQKLCTWCQTERSSFANSMSEKVSHGWDAFQYFTRKTVSNVTSRVEKMNYGQYGDGLSKYTDDKYMLRKSDEIPQDYVDSVRQNTQTTVSSQNEETIKQIQILDMEYKLGAMIKEQSRHPQNSVSEEMKTFILKFAKVDVELVKGILESAKSSDPESRNDYDAILKEIEGASNKNDNKK